MRALRHLAVLLGALLVVAPILDASALTRAQKEILFGRRFNLSVDFRLISSLPAAFAASGGANGTRVNAAGLIAAASAPRFDYDLATLVPKGLLVEAASTNNITTSGDLSNGAVWTALGPTVTGNFTTAPDGTATAAKIVYSACSGAGSICVVYTVITGTAATYADSVYLKGAAGGESIYLSATTDGSTFYRVQANLTTAWQRFQVEGAESAASWTFEVGVDLRDASQSSKSAQTVYAWGAQRSLAPTNSLIPTTVAPVTRSADSLTRTASGRYILQRRAIATGTRDRIDGAAGSVTFPTGYWIERYVEYGQGVNAAYTGAHLAVDGPF